MFLVKAMDFPGKASTTVNGLIRRRGCSIIYIPYKLLEICCWLLVGCWNNKRCNARRKKYMAPDIIIPLASAVSFNSGSSSRSHDIALPGDALNRDAVGLVGSSFPPPRRRASGKYHLNFFCARFSPLASIMTRPLCLGTLLAS